MICPICNKDVADGIANCPACGVSLDEPPPPLFALPRGTSLQKGRYTIEEVLGAGGWGITYKAHDEKLGRTVAIKELFLLELCVRQQQGVYPLPNLGQQGYSEYKRRLLREAQLLASLNHPGIVKVYDQFEENNTAYMVMEFVEGRTLEEELKAIGGPMSEQKAVAYILQVCEALKVIHGKNYLHRDIKPSNIMVRNDGSVVLIDFGIARQFAGGRAQSMTHVIGTPLYGAPEQIQNGSGREPYGPPADIYALGATLYYLLTGKEPVPAVERAVGIVLPSIRQVNPRVSRDMEAAVMKAMEMKPEDRPQSVKEFADLLQQALNPPVPVAKVTKPQPPRSTHRMPSVYTSALARQVGEQVGKVTGALSGAAVGLGVGLIAGLLLLAAGAIVGAIAGALGLAIAGAEAGGDEGCFAILAGLVIGGVIGYLLGIVVGALLGLAATVSGLAMGGVRGTQIGMNLGGYLSTRWGAVPTSLLLSALTSGMIGVVWVGVVLGSLPVYAAPLEWTEAIPVVGFFMAIGAIAGGAIGSLSFWVMVRRQGGQMPSTERLSALISVPVGIGVALWLFSAIRVPQVWIDGASVWDRWYALIEYRLRYGSWPEGWMARAPSSTPQRVKYQVRYVQPPQVTVRARTAKSARIVAVVKQGQPVYVIAVSRDGAWAYVKLPSGKKGYVTVSSLGAEPPPKEASASRRVPAQPKALPSSVSKRPSSAPPSASDNAMKDKLAAAPTAKKEPAPDTPKVLEFSAEPSVISAGGTVTLRWRVQGASRVTIDNGVGEVGLRGEIAILPLQDTITLTATDDAGKTVTRSVKITVSSTPAVTQPPADNPLPGH